MSVIAPVETFQNDWELGYLTEIYHSLCKSRVAQIGTPLEEWKQRPHTRALEIGAMYGGTLWHWMKAFTTLVVVDDEMREAETWERWGEKYLGEFGELVLLQGLSQDPALINAVRREGPYDFIFIDGDHRYESVKADWENYRTMVNEGGIVAFHDILPRPDYGVSDVWAEIKTEATRYMEICQNETLPSNEGPCGIGIVWLD